MEELETPHASNDTENRIREHFHDDWLVGFVMARGVKFEPFAVRFNVSSRPREIVEKLCSILDESDFVVTRIKTESGLIVSAAKESLRDFNIPPISKRKFTSEIDDKTLVGFLSARMHLTSWGFNISRYGDARPIVEALRDRGIEPAVHSVGIINIPKRYMDHPLLGEYTGSCRADVQDAIRNSELPAEELSEEEVFRKWEQLRDTGQIENGIFELENDWFFGFLWTSTEIKNEFNVIQNWSSYDDSIKNKVVDELEVRRIWNRQSDRHLLLLLPPFLGDSLKAGAFHEDMPLWFLFGALLGTNPNMLENRMVLTNLRRIQMSELQAFLKQLRFLGLDVEDDQNNVVVSLKKDCTLSEMLRLFARDNILPQTILRFSTDNVFEVDLCPFCGYCRGSPRIIILREEGPLKLRVLCATENVEFVVPATEASAVFRGHIRMRSRGEGMTA